METERVTLEVTMGFDYSFKDPDNLSPLLLDPTFPNRKLVVIETFLFETLLEKRPAIDPYLRISEEQRGRMFNKAADLVCAKTLHRPKPEHVLFFELEEFHGSI